MNHGSLSPSRELEKSEHVSFANVGKAADGAQVAAEVVSSRTVSVITQEVECAHSGEPVSAAEQPFVAALAKSGNNPRVECADVCDLVGPEPKFALVGPEHAMQVEAMQAEECVVVGESKRTELKSESIAMKRSAGNESGAAAKKLRCGDGVEGQIRISYSTCFDPRLDRVKWREVFREGHGWLRLERVLPKPPL